MIENNNFLLLIGNFNQWKPTEEQWNKALDFIDDVEEKKRIMCFKRPEKNGNWLSGKDNPNAKASLIGRKLMMIATHQLLNIPYSSMKFSRDENNKPYLVQTHQHPLHPNFNFNVSHDGDYTILLASKTIPIGIDIMKPIIREPLNEFFKNMKICFTDYEWKNITNFKLSDTEKTKEFFRHWTLKESFIKTSGVGLNMDLKRIEFHISDDKSTAFVKLDGLLSKDFQFQLFDINTPLSDQTDTSPYHMVGICYQSQDLNLSKQFQSVQNSLEFKDIF